MTENVKPVLGMYIAVVQVGNRKHREGEHALVLHVGKCFSLSTPWT